MRNILIVFVAVFVALAAVPAAAQTTGTATVTPVVKRAWILLSGHVWEENGRTYINAGCQNIDPQPWGDLTTTVTLDLKIFYRGGGSNPMFGTRRTQRGQPCDLGKGIDIVTWELTNDALLWGEGWDTQADLRIQLISGNNPAHLGPANNTGSLWARLYFNGTDDPYPGTGIRSGGRVVTEDELYDPGDYER